MLHASTRGAGLLGGAVWAARLGLDLAGALGPTASDALLWTGAALLAVGVLGLGLGLVPRAPGWLRGVVAVGSVALAGSVVAVLHGDGDGVVVDGVLGLAAIVVFAAALLRGRGPRGDSGRSGRSGGTAGAGAPARRPGRRRADTRSR